MEYYLSNNILKLRKQKHLTQSQLAKLTGLTQHTISFIENYQYGCTAINAFKICLALGCKFEDCFYLSYVDTVEGEICSIFL